MKSDKRLWLTADKSRIVPDGDPAAAFLLVGEGDTITAADLEVRGLSVTLEDIRSAHEDPRKQNFAWGEAPPEQQPEPDPEPDPRTGAKAADTKAVKGPPEDKSQRPPRDSRK